MKRTSLFLGSALVLALGATSCGKGCSKSEPAAHVEAKADVKADAKAAAHVAATADATPRAIQLPPSAALPGALLLAEHGGVSRLGLQVPAARTAVPSAGPGLRLFPTAAWRGATLVGIAVKDEGELHGEQLALIDLSSLGSLASLGSGAATVAPRLVGPVAQVVRSPSLSPDGKWLYFEASHQSFRDLYRLELSAAGERAGHELPVSRLTDNREGNFTPSLSPDGKRLAFASSRDGDSEIYVMDLDGKPVAGRPPVRRLTAFHRDDLLPSWTPAGEVTFLSDRLGVDRIFLVSAAGTDLRRATDEADAKAIESSPAWSPSGQLAYLRTVTGTGARAELRVGAPGTSSWQTLTPAGHRAGSFAWSPDGQWLASVEVPREAPGAPGGPDGHAGDDGHGHGAARLVVYQADGKARFELLDAVDAEATLRWVQ